MTFIGPDSDAIYDMGLKHIARDMAIYVDVPVMEGCSRLVGNVDAALGQASAMGFLIILKSANGGGGVGQQVCWSLDEVPAALTQVQSRLKELFGNLSVFIEKYYLTIHHIEARVFGNGSEVKAFGERECSIRRRHQKVIDECPTPNLVDRPELRNHIIACAKVLAGSMKYRSAGTVEFLVDDETGRFFLLEMNTRLQVEHGITELCYSVDIVSLMLQQAAYRHAGLPGIPLDELRNMRLKTLKGAAIEARYAARIRPIRFSGHVQLTTLPHHCARVDIWIDIGTYVSPFSVCEFPTMCRKRSDTVNTDSLLAKAMVHRSTREEAIVAMQEALSESDVGGPVTNLEVPRHCYSIPVAPSFYTHEYHYILRVHQEVLEPHDKLYFYVQRDATIRDAVLLAVRMFEVPIYGLPTEQMVEDS
ncbi:carbamoyl-phosphate synthase L chain, ATP binding domain-containing protein [Hypoxylon sp. NC1633]|nr:carbamoyl-phosphate synthase L chain, ATP binding domain-containing protein [Hypoxylon sp. NC1633]